MKKHISIFMLMVRTSIWKVLLILLGLVTTQVVLFLVLGAGQEPYLLDALERLPYFPLWISFFLVSCALYMPLSDRGGRMNNLILRLGLSEKRIFWIQVLVNALVYLLFLGTQAMIMLLLCAIYNWMTPGKMDLMTIFVTSYQHPMFHRVFPLHDLVGWGNLLVLVAGLSICTAASPIRQRHRFNSLSTTIMTAFAAFHFCSPMDLSDHLDFSEFILPVIFTICLVPVCLMGVLSMEVDESGKA